jgi:hypothetical protein
VDIALSIATGAICLALVALLWHIEPSYRDRRRRAVWPRRLLIIGSGIYAIWLVARTLVAG